MTHIRAAHAYHGHAGTARPQRRSGIELLRIVAMLMILAHHFIVHNGTAISTLPDGLMRFLLVTFLGYAGKIGVMVFFTISTWFFLDRDQSVLSGFKRVWLLERELLFYGVLLGVSYTLLDPDDTTPQFTRQFVYPWSGWWYVVAYVQFLLLMPVLQAGLKSLNRRAHISLAVFCLLLLGVLPYLPVYANPGDGVLTFILLYIMIAAYKWHCKQFGVAGSIGLVITGIVLLAAQNGILELSIRRGRDTDPLKYATLYGVPVLLVGFGLFLLCQRMTFRSAIVNRIAQSAFAVYLITDYPASRNLLWHRLFDLGGLWQQSHTTFRIIVILLGIYAACTLFDFIRQLLFAMTVDRHKGRWFDIVSTHVMRLIHE